MDRANYLIRKAKMEDVAALEGLIQTSVQVLQAGDYSGRQREGALGTVFGVDRLLIRDETYFVVEVDRRIVGCGGWSRRKTLFGSDHAPGKDDARLDPASDPARIRAFFVDPAWARRGIGNRLMQACEAAAAAEGFSKLELVATLTGEPLYRAHGFLPVEHFEVPLANGERLPVIRMRKTLP